MNYLSDKRYIMKMSSPNDSIIDGNDSIKRKADEEDINQVRKKQVKK